MIKIEITAEDYYIADAMRDLSNQIEGNDLLDEVYDGKEITKTVKGEYYTATITKE